MWLSSYLLALAALAWTAAAVGPGPSQPRRVNARDVLRIYATQYMRQVRDRGCTFCVDRCLDPDMPFEAYNPVGSIEDFGFPQNYDKKDCPQLCSRWIQSVVPGEIDLFIRDAGEGFQRLGPQGVIAWNAMSPRKQAKKLKNEGKRQECSMEDAGMRGPDPANPIVQEQPDWDRMWAELRQTLNVPPLPQPGGEAQRGGGSQPLPDFKRGKGKKKKQQPGKGFGTGGEPGPGGEPGAGGESGPGDTTKFGTASPDAPSYYYSPEASGCIRSTMTVLQNPKWRPGAEQLCNGAVMGAKMLMGSGSRSTNSGRGGASGAFPGLPFLKMPGGVRVPLLRPL